MSFPDFREPLLVEIELARQINVAAYAMLPRANGGDKRADLSTALAHIALEHIGDPFALRKWCARKRLCAHASCFRNNLQVCLDRFGADDTKVAHACMGRDVYGDLKDVIRNIEAGFEGTGWATAFGKIRLHIRALHERTHSGGEQTLRRLKAQDMRTPEYDFGELIRDIRTLAGAAILVAIPVATQEDVGKLNALMVANYSWLAGSATV